MITLLGSTEQVRAVSGLDARLPRARGTRLTSRMHKRTITLLSLLALALPQVALASSDAVIKDCADNGKLDKKYSKSDLKKAKSNLPSDINEYTDCGSAINRAIASSGGGGGSGGGPAHAPQAQAAASSGSSGSGSSSVTASGGGTGTGSSGRAKAAVPPRPTSAKPAVPVGGQTVTPGANGLFKASESVNEIPLPILLALIGIAALTAAGGALVMRRRGGFRAALRFARR